MNAIVNIGSNLGDRRLNLSRAMRAVMMRYGDLEMSHVVESEPWGFDSPHKFLNACLIFSTGETPEELLASLQDIERGISADSHRTAEGGYSDRVIDIDIVALDEKVIDTPVLKVPHPHLAERLFFLEPLAEVAPEWRHPENGMTAAEMLSRLKHLT